MGQGLKGNNTKTWRAKIWCNAKLRELLGVWLTKIGLDVIK